MPRRVANDETLRQALPQPRQVGREPCRQAVILSAGLGTRIAIATMGRPKALLAAGARPVIVAQVRQLRRSGAQRVILVHRPGDDRHLLPLMDQAFRGAGLDIRFVVQESPSGPLDAVASAAEQLSFGELILLLGDTLLCNLDELPIDSVGVGNADNVREFCVVRVDHRGRIIGFEDKPQRDEPSDMAVVGVYRFASAELVRSLLEQQATFVTGELSDLLRSYARQRPLSAARVEGWSDLGSYSRYVAANRRALTGRADHTFAVGDEGFVIKSGDRNRMSAQARWYRDLPESAAGLAPRLVDAGDGWYRVELLDCPSLAQLLLYEPVTSSTWRFLLGQLLSTIETRLWGPTRHTSTALPEWCERKYITKTESRLAGWSGWDRLRARRLIVNGTELLAFDEVWQDAVAALRELSTTATQACVIHGDMTFSNILLARGYGVFKLIDPGTAFSNASGGDVRYDLAKLRQSYASGYDGLSEDLFELERSQSDEWDLRMFACPSPIASIGDDVLTGAGYDLHDIRLLEAVQFLSMVPLHGDNPDRQLALYAVGLHLLTAVLERRSHAAFL